jgi:HD-GYP domain-containing protein (c-di-GMP phosphodiesterase class II)
MTEERVYREKRSKEEALEEIMNHSGTQFDPAIVEIFAQCIR